MCRLVLCIIFSIYHSQCLYPSHVVFDFFIIIFLSFFFSAIYFLLVCSCVSSISWCTSVNNSLSFSLLPLLPPLSMCDLQSHTFSQCLVKINSYFALSCRNVYWHTILACFALFVCWLAACHPCKMLRISRADLLTFCICHNILWKKLLLKLAVSHSHRILILSQPVVALNLWGRQRTEWPRGGWD